MGNVILRPFARLRIKSVEGSTFHVFQGRYKAILVDKENYLLELCRYIVLNPVRAKTVTTVEKSPWSSYRATEGETVPPKWLAADQVVSFYSGRRSSYRRFVSEGISQGSILGAFERTNLFGRGRISRAHAKLVDRRAAHGIAKAQRKPMTPSMDEIVDKVGSAYGISTSQVLDRNHVEAYWLAAYLMRRVGKLPLADVARRVGVSPARISQIQTRIEHGKTSPKMDTVLKHCKVKG